MGNVLSYTRLNLNVDSSDNDKLKDSAVALNDDNKILDDEKRSVDDSASDKEIGKPGQSGVDKVPKKPRTPRVFLGQLSCEPGEDAYQDRNAQMITDEKNSRGSEKHPLDEDCIVADGVSVGQFMSCEPEKMLIKDRSAQMIIDEKNSRESEKHPIDQDYIVSDGVLVGQLTGESGEDAYQFRSAQVITYEKNLRESEKRPLDEEYIVSNGVLVGQLTCEPREDAYQYRNAKVVIDEKNSRKFKKRPLDEGYFVFDDDNRVESSDKKRQKTGEKKAVVVGRKQTPQVHNDPPPDLPQNLQDYISKLNLEAPLLFVAQKFLYPSDVLRNLHRLLLPKSLINKAFLENFVTDKEKKMLMEKENIRVSLVDNKMHEYHTLNFVKWEMTNSSNYALKTGWFDVVTDNKLEVAVLQKDVNKLEEATSPKKRRKDTVVVMKEDDKLKSPVVAQLWCSRKEGRLWFALNIQATTEHNVVGKTKDGHNIITRLIN